MSIPKPDITIRLQTGADRDMETAVLYAKSFDAIYSQIFPTYFPSSAPERKLLASGDSPWTGSETARD
jgi:hypothetical protein